MNRYQKEKSREIRDIMRTDKWGRMTYKEAKRKWRKGIRAFRIGDSYIWKAADLSHLGLSRSRLTELGRAYGKIMKYANERGLIFTCEYEPFFDSYQLRFKGTMNGRRYGISHSVTGCVLRLYGGPFTDIADRVRDEVNHKLQEFHFPSVAKPVPEIESLYPRMTIHPWEPMSVEEVLSKLVEGKGEKNENRMD